MQRIGIAASHMSKGNVWTYNAFVVLLTVLFSTLMFVIIGATVLFSLLIIAYLGRELDLTDMGRQDWMGVFRICMVVLTTIITGWSLIAIGRNVRLKHPRHNG